MKYAWIRDHRDRFEVRLMCQVLDVSRSGFYVWLKEPAGGKRQAYRDELAEQILQVHRANRGVYGSPRVTVELNEQGVAVCENTVAKVMKERQIRAKTPKRFVPRTTDSAHAHAVADNLLDRQFDAAAAPSPNTCWAADITYVPTDQGWLYVAAVIDLCSRRIVGWSMADHMRAELVGNALQMAIAQRNPAAGELLHHSDRGAQYACDDYQHLLQSNGIMCSMSRAGDCYDNAVMESFWATLKTECVYQASYATRSEARSSIFDYIEVFYNRKRRHSSLGYVSPEAFEAAFN